MKVQWANDFIDLFYPEVCNGCSNPLLKNESVLCISCLSNLPKTNYHLQSENPILEIFSGRCLFEKACSYLFFVKGGIVQSIMHQFKYKNNPQLAEYMGYLAAQDLLESGFFSDIDLILPIPLHPAKLKKRGYNQSLHLAKGLGEKAGLDYRPDILVRINNNSTQTRKSRFDRWLNVESIFAVNDPKQLRNKHVLLVDDVLTTGSTLEAAVMKMEQINGIKLSLFTLAYTK